MEEKKSTLEDSILDLRKTEEEALKLAKQEVIAENQKRIEDKVKNLMEEYLDELNEADDDIDDIEENELEESEEL